TDGAAASADCVAGCAAISLVHLRAARGIARKRLALPPSQAANEGGYLPGLTRAHRVARHAGSGNASIDDAEQCLVCRCVAERRAREVGAPAAVAVSAVTVGALRVEERPAARDLLRGHPWTCRRLERHGHLQCQ